MTANINDIFESLTRNDRVGLSADWLRHSLVEFLTRPDNLPDVIANLEQYRTQWIREAFHSRPPATNVKCQ